LPLSLTHKTDENRFATGMHVDMLCSSLDLRWISEVRVRKGRQRRAERSGDRKRENG